MQPKISIITVSLNDADRLYQTQRNICEQTWPEIERVVIDGGSRDCSLEKLSTIPPDILVSEPDSGIYDAMEKGSRLATGDILYFLNAGDMFYDSDVLRDVVSFFETTGCDAAFGNLVPKLDDTRARVDHPGFRADTALDFAYFNNRRRFYDECIHHQATFYRRSIFNTCSFLCLEPAASGEYYLNACAFVQHGYRLKHIPRLIAHFALGGVSTADFASEWDRFVRARHVIRKSFFPAGPRIGIDEKHEYLTGKPGLKNLARIIVRDFGQFLGGNDWRAQLRYSLRKLHI
jgi:glycosyltransferase involved in cell wall biosynthesis